MGGEVLPRVTWPVSPRADARPPSRAARLLLTDLGLPPSLGSKTLVPEEPSLGGLAWAGLRAAGAVSGPRPAVEAMHCRVLTC